jgi:hypothetical protein
LSEFGCRRLTDPLAAECNFRVLQIGSWLIHQTYPVLNPALIDPMETGA